MYLHVHLKVKKNINFASFTAQNAFGRHCTKRSICLYAFITIKELRGECDHLVRKRRVQKCAFGGRVGINARSPTPTCQLIAKEALQPDSWPQSTFCGLQQMLTPNQQSLGKTQNRAWLKQPLSNTFPLLLDQWMPWTWPSAARVRLSKLSRLISLYWTRLGGQCLVLSLTRTLY